MHPILRNILVVVAGIIIGVSVNMTIVKNSDALIPYPAGTDISTPEGINATMPLFQPKHFIMPFLAHAIGTFVGALIVGLFAATHNLRLAMVIGIINLIGGISAVYMIRAPLWFNVVDLLFAYIPMAYLGGLLGMKWSRRNVVEQPMA